MTVPSGVWIILAVTAAICVLALFGWLSGAWDMPH
jgi:hypothetical protein